MQKEFKAVLGQSLVAICLNTYGTLDHLVKLAEDNGIDDLGYVARTGDVFVFETDLVENLNTLRDIELKETKYLTAAVVDPVDYGLNYDL